MSASSKTRETVSNFILLIIRLGSAALMLTHGWPKAMKLIDGGEIKFADPFGMGMTISLVLAVFAEVICATLVGIGLKTRLATVPLLITLVTAAFIVTRADPIATQEKAFLYLMIYLVILVKGAGKFSVDFIVFRKK